MDTETLTPWGETWDALADAVLDDKGAPPVLALAAFRAKHGDERKLRALVEAAVELNETGHPATGKEGA